jgi:hypothetical protein
MLTNSLRRATRQDYRRAAYSVIKLWPCQSS